MAGTGITAINSLTGSVQTLGVGTSGTDFAISSSGTSHTFNLPTASASNRGALSSSDWTTFNTAYTDRLKWDGGATGLVAATGRTSLGLGTFAVANYPTWSSGTPFVKMTAAGTFALDTNTYLTSIGTGTTNELTYWSGTNTLGSLSTSTYPSLTELSYVKGVTSAIQTQINTKLSTTTAASTYAPISTKEIFNIGFTPSNFLSSTTTYFGFSSTSNATTQGTRRIYFNRAGTITGITLFTYAATITGSNESWTMYARLNQTTDYSIATVGAATAARLWTNLSMSIPISSSSDYIEIKSITPAFVTQPTGVYGGGFIEFTPT
jgi:hypothetical protein